MVILVQIKVKGFLWKCVKEASTYSQYHRMKQLPINKIYWAVLTIEKLSYVILNILRQIVWYLKSACSNFFLITLFNECFGITLVMACTHQTVLMLYILFIWVLTSLSTLHRLYHDG